MFANLHVSPWRHFQSVSFPVAPYRLSESGLLEDVCDLKVVKVAEVMLVDAIFMVCWLICEYLEVTARRRNEC